LNLRKTPIAAETDESFNEIKRLPKKETTVNREERENKHSFRRGRKKDHLQDLKPVLRSRQSFPDDGHDLTTTRAEKKKRAGLGLGRWQTGKRERE
jgi:hypothetical protein